MLPTEQPPWPVEMKKSLCTPTNVWTGPNVPAPCTGVPHVFAAMHTPPLMHAGMHVNTWHAPFTHDPALTFPHIPQFFGSVLRFASQPFPAIASQSPKPALHPMHLAATHGAFAPHFSAHMPQLFTS